MEPHERIIVALDVSDIGVAQRLADDLHDHVGGFKLGLEWMACALADLLATPSRNEAHILLDKYRALHASVRDKLMWDGKFHDIPHTMAGATRNVGRLTQSYFTIHASAGKEAMRQVVANCGGAIPTAVTVLTSIDSFECRSIFGDIPKKKVLCFVRHAVQCGITTIVCSPAEAEYLRGIDEFDCVQFVTPGVRPLWALTGDQDPGRVMTPAKAVLIDPTRRLVIGRPIRNPPPEIGTPVDAAKRIAEEIAEALA